MSQTSIWRPKIDIGGFLNGKDVRMGVEHHPQNVRSHDLVLQKLPFLF